MNLDQKLIELRSLVPVLGQLTRKKIEQARRENLYDFDDVSFSNEILGCGSWTIDECKYIQSILILPAIEEQIFEQRIFSSYFYESQNELPPFVAITMYIDGSAELYIDSGLGSDNYSPKLFKPLAELFSISSEEGIVKGTMEEILTTAVSLYEEIVADFGEVIEPVTIVETQNILQRLFEKLSFNDGRFWLHEFYRCIELGELKLKYKNRKLRVNQMRSCGIKLRATIMVPEVTLPENHFEQYFFDTYEYSLFQNIMFVNFKNNNMYAWHKAIEIYELPEGLTSHLHVIASFNDEGIYQNFEAIGAQIDYFIKSQRYGKYIFYRLTNKDVYFTLELSSDSTVIKHGSVYDIKNGIFEGKDWQVVYAIDN